MMRSKGTITEDDWLSVLQLKSHAEDVQSKDDEKWAQANIISMSAINFMEPGAQFSPDLIIQIVCAVRYLMPSTTLS